MIKGKMETKRIVSLDVFRGLTIVLMILVNAQGPNPYPLLEHAQWHGGTFADVVFPFFLFIVGLTAVVALNRRVDEDKATLYWNILKRSLILLGLGLFLNIYPVHLYFGHIRYYGILQRIALCYFFGSIIYLNTSVKTQILIFLGILFGYWLLMTKIPVPGFGVNQLTESGSWVAYFDQLLLSSHHLYAKVYDPEGFLSTIPSLATTLLGMLTGSLLLRPDSSEKKFIIMMGLGLIFLCFAWLWSMNFPINKNIWTSSYVLWSGGYALIVFALCFYVIDMLGYQKWALPLKIFGMNALFIFILHVLMLKTQAWFLFTLKNGQIGNLRVAMTDYLFGFLGPQNAALMHAICFVIINYLVALYLYNRKIFIRI